MGVQKMIQAEEDNYWREKIQSYVMQGDFLRLIAEEDSNLTWKGFLWGVPRGVARFAINAGLNTLPTADNLKRWGKQTSDLCQVCNGQGKQTLNHVLSSCKVALEQGRFTFRHDSVLRTVVDFMGGKLKDGFSLYCDLTGRGAGGGGTLPQDILAIACGFIVIIAVLHPKKLEIKAASKPAWPPPTTTISKFSFINLIYFPTQKSEKTFFNMSLVVVFPVNRSIFEIAVRISSAMISSAMGLFVK